jgi:hypothetical protein
MARLLALTMLVATTLCAPLALANGPTKDECIEAHGRGQDAREAGRLSLARRLFLSCAQKTCPALIQDDCARFSDELDRAQPNVTFAARDRGGADLPDTTVYVDGVLTATRLDDGKLHDVDPGQHAIRFRSGSREITQTVVVNEGERGRLILATFGPVVAPALGHLASSAPEPLGTRPSAPLWLAGGGVALVATGITLGVLGLRMVPSGCSLSGHTCAVPPGDPALDRARSAVTLTDVGLAIGGAGLAATSMGLLWRLVAPRRIETGRTWTPWVVAGGGGLSVGGPL